ncbi:MAG TPA: alpha/beta hydrolase [Chitinophaga sp.]|uniref:alpha/beta hydrolase n=1 Tax=Chitinophaga sp. TaxID=1869181 RepID=UPI002DBA7CF5|nr:alpha/beta hydrolase [Chitinophaga sp.]HEU4556161.1 alpha/beta hydrolase [Chitinophaga sp.]
MKCFFHDTIKIPVGKATLEAVLTLPEGATSIVIFSLASSRSRYSRRYQKVAQQLQQRGFGTLLADLLTDEEDAAYYYTRTNIELLTRRLTGITEWLECYGPATHLSLGYFAAGTGAAAALKAAYYLPHIQAVVCQGGRPDMAEDLLPYIATPVLLIAGTLDADMLGHSRLAFEKLQCRKKLLEIKGAGQLFVENNAMTLIMESAANWFHHYLKVPDHQAS